MEPAGICTVSVLVQGPVALAAKLPCGELDARVTATGCVSPRVTPASCRRTVSGPAAVPAVSVTGAFANTTVGVDQVAKSFQPSLNHPPSIAFVHHAAHAVVGS